MRAQPKPGQDASLLDLAHNGLEYEFSSRFIPANVSGKMRDRIPDLPVITLAQSKVAVPLGGRAMVAGGAQAGSRALERLGHRTAVAG